MHTRPALYQLNYVATLTTTAKVESKHFPCGLLVEHHHLKDQVHRQLPHSDPVLCLNPDLVPLTKLSFCPGPRDTLCLITMVLLHQLASPKSCPLLPHRCRLHRGLLQAGSSPQARTSDPHAHSLGDKNRGERGTFRLTAMSRGGLLHAPAPVPCPGAEECTRMKATAPGAPSYPPLPPSPALKQGGAHHLPRAPSHTRFQVPEHRGQQSPASCWGWMQALTHWTWAQVTTPL